jgi:cytidylate kinase
MGEKGGIVMDGRDIGTVVFPHADIKIFVTASIEVRTQRRLLELQTKGIETSKEEVQDNLIERDFIDSNRKESPLRQAVDAIVLDNSTLSRQQQLEWALDLVRSR